MLFIFIELHCSLFILCCLTEEIEDKFFFMIAMVGIAVIPWLHAGKVNACLCQSSSNLNVLTLKRSGYWKLVSSSQGPNWRVSVPGHQWCRLSRDASTWTWLRSSCRCTSTHSCMTPSTPSPPSCTTASNTWPMAFFSPAALHGVSSCLRDAH